jgi:hypothetical protein
MAELEAKSGIVGFFDVLGYQSIIDNNKIDDAASVISKTLLTLPKTVTDAVGALLTKGEALPEISWLIISDTIILAAPFSRGAGVRSRLRTWIRLIVHSAYLMRKTFDAGLPMRSVIDIGEFYIEGHSFAGKPIIRAFREAHEMEAAGCMLTTAADEAFHADLDEFASTEEEKAGTVSNYMSQIVFPYLMPQKNEDRNRRAVVNWMKPMKEFDPPPSDLRQYVFEAFHAFSKDVPKSVVPKLENTERLLRYCSGKLWQKKS